MSWFELYLLTRSDHVYGVFHNLGLLFMIGAVIAAVASAVAHSEQIEAFPSLLRLARHSLIAAAVCFCMKAAVPTNDDIYIMLGGYYATNSVQMKDLPENVVGAVNDFLKQHRSTPKD